MRPGAKVFIHPMPDGFDGYFKAALISKKVPVVVVGTRDKAELEIKRLRKRSSPVPGKGDR